MLAHLLRENNNSIFPVFGERLDLWCVILLVVVGCCWLLVFVVGVCCWLLVVVGWLLLVVVGTYFRIRGEIKTGVETRYCMDGEVIVRKRNADAADADRKMKTIKR
jgi:hypothetical protein